jgi:hypothetical protein
MIGKFAFANLVIICLIVLGGSVLLKIVKRKFED